MLPEQIKNEQVGKVDHDTGHAVLEFGHNPRPQILMTKKKTATSPETFDTCPAAVESKPGQVTHRGARTHDHKVKSLALYRLS